MKRHHVVGNTDGHMQCNGKPRPPSKPRYVINRAGWDQPEKNQDPQSRSLKTRLDRTKSINRRPHCGPKAMKRKASSPPPFLVFAAVAIASSLVAISMAVESAPAAAQEASVHIVYVDRPEGDDPEEFHISTLSSVLGSEEKAKEAVLYHYKHAASGFSAKLTPDQVEELKKQPGVLQVVPSQTYQLLGPGAGAQQLGGATHKFGLM